MSLESEEIARLTKEIIRLSGIVEKLATKRATHQRGSRPQEYARLLATHKKLRAKYTNLRASNRKLTARVVNAKKAVFELRVKLQEQKNAYDELEKFMKLDNVVDLKLAA